MPWVKGQSGNPYGRPLGGPPEKKLFIAECRKQWEKVFKILEQSLESTIKEDRRWAVEILLDRAFGKPETSGVLEVETNESIRTPESIYLRAQEFKALIADATQPVRDGSITPSGGSETK